MTQTTESLPILPVMSDQSLVDEEESRYIDTLSEFREWCAARDVSFKAALMLIIRERLDGRAGLPHALRERGGQ